MNTDLYCSEGEILSKVKKPKNMHELLIPIILSDKKFYMRFRSTEGNEETIQLTQNTALNGELWKIEFENDNWRTVSEMVSLLRCVAGIIEEEWL